jgi:hypothetical protein
MDPELLIPLAAVILMFGIPIVAILTGHQRKMAELMRQPIQGQQPMSNIEIQALRAEVRELKQMLADQSLAIDQIRGASSVSTPPSIPIHERLNG